MSAPSTNPYKKNKGTSSLPQPTSENPVRYLDKEVDAWMDLALQNPTPENIAMAHDLQLRYAEYLDAIITGLPKVESKSILVHAKGVTVKFGDIDQIATWLAEANDE